MLQHKIPPQIQHRTTIHLKNKKKKYHPNFRFEIGLNWSSSWICTRSDFNFSSRSSSHSHSRRGTQIYKDNNAPELRRANALLRRRSEEKKCGLWDRDVIDAGARQRGSSGSRAAGSKHRSTTLGNATSAHRSTQVGVRIQRTNTMDGWNLGWRGWRKPDALIVQLGHYHYPGYSALPRRELPGAGRYPHSVRYVQRVPAARSTGNSAASSCGFLAEHGESELRIQAAIEPQSNGQSDFIRRRSQQQPSRRLCMPWFGSRFRCAMSQRNTSIPIDM